MRMSVSMAKPTAPMMMMPITTTPVRRKFLAFVVIDPTP